MTILFHAFPLALYFTRPMLLVEDESIYSVPDFLPITPRMRSQSTISLGSLTSVLLNAKRRHTTFSSWSVDRKLVIRIHSASRITYG